MRNQHGALGKGLDNERTNRNRQAKSPTPRSSRGIFAALANKDFDAIPYADTVVLSTPRRAASITPCAAKVRYARFGGRR